MFGVVLAWAAYRLVRFVFVTADWEIVRRNLRLFMVGRFPSDQLWRPWAAAYVLAAALGLCVGVASGVPRRADPRRRRTRRRRADRSAAPRRGLRRFWPLVAVRRGHPVAHPHPAARDPARRAGRVVMVAAGPLGRRAPVPGPVALGDRAVVGRCSPRCRSSWPPAASGGTTGAGCSSRSSSPSPGIVLAFPVGLSSPRSAAGRRCRSIRMLSVGYIELFRGVPLVTLPVHRAVPGRSTPFPTSVDPPSFLVRALIAIALFESAYIAEIVRGGLQSVPRARSRRPRRSGLGPFQTMRRVVLPQALRAVIPAMVGQFISLFKDTSLLAIVGFFEILDVAGACPAQPAFVGQGLASITLAFAGFLYWVGCYTMSRESRRLERRLGVGDR